VVCLHDAVYADLTFDGHKHHWFATLANNWERTITICSAGKLFNATAWRIGWAIGPQKLVYYGGIIAVTLFETFQTPGQVALARVFDQAFNLPFSEVTDEAGNKKSLTFLENLKDTFQANRDFMSKSFADLPIPCKPIKCDGGYFLILDVAACRDAIPEKYLKTHDYEDPNPALGPLVEKWRFNLPSGEIPLDLAFCRWIMIEYGVVTLPCSKFYGRTSTTTLEDKYVRVSLSQPIEVLKVAMDRLKSKMIA
jgi:aspartate/methionine/tyrosine aminotransferase